jgi:uncharacterized protein involved in exopolysaccharide biosynthesis
MDGDIHTERAPLNTVGCAAANILRKEKRMKRLVLVVVVFVLVAAPVIAGVWALIVPQYEAKGEIRVRPIIPRLVFQTEENGAIPFYDSFVNTQVSFLRSPTVLQRVLEQAEVQRTQWFRSPRKTLMERWTGDALPPVERLRGGLRTQPRPQTEIIDVSFRDISAKDAKIIVDAVLEQYIKYVSETTNATEDMLYRQLADQYNSLKNEIQGRESVIAALHKSLGTETPEDLLSHRRLRLDDTQARLAELRNRIAVLEWEVKQPAAPRDTNNLADPLQKQPKYHEDAEWRALDLDVRRAQHQVDKSVLTPNAPDRAGLIKDLAFAQELRRVREQQLDEQWNDRRQEIAGHEGGVVPVERQLARAKVEEQLLRVEWGRQSADFNDLLDRAQSLAREDAALQRKRELFDAVRQRLDQKNMERGVPGCIEILAMASVPAKPAPDHRVPFTAGALLLGLCVSGGTAVLTRKRNNVPAGSDGSA